MNVDDLSLFSEDDFDPHVLPDSQLSDKVIAWLSDLYNTTDWRFVTLDLAPEYEYDGIPIISYFKALALPYLVNLPLSERALGKIIRVRENIQRLCGFRIGPFGRKINASSSEIDLVIGERSFWHFRNKYKDLYAELLTKVLISLVLSGKYPNLDLPFVEPIGEKDFNDEGNLVNWVIDAYRSPITISLPLTEKSLPEEQDADKVIQWKAEWKERFAKCRDLNEYREVKKEYDEAYMIFVRRTKKAFTEEIIFPIDLSTTLTSGEKVVFRLKSPDWLNRNVNGMQLSSLTREDSKSVRPRTKYDKACNILVMRIIDGEEEILLSRRKDQGIGEGNYAAPGGKQKEGESLEECAKRELREETGLVLDASKPVSIYYTRKDYMGGKQIMSVGVLAVSWHGNIETKEPKKHAGWEWYKIKNRPSPLFEFTEIAINQYIANTYRDLNWDDLEEKPNTQLTFIEDE